MRGFAIPDADVAVGTSCWLRAIDLLGRQHFLRLDEASMHTRNFSCACRPKFVDGVIVHRRFAGRSLFKPWERGH